MSCLSWGVPLLWGVLMRGGVNFLINFEESKRRFNKCFVDKVQKVTWVYKGDRGVNVSDLLALFALRGR